MKDPILLSFSIDFRLSPGDLLELLSGVMLVTSRLQGAQSVSPETYTSNYAKYLTVIDETIPSIRHWQNQLSFYLQLPKQSFNERPKEIRNEPRSRSRFSAWVAGRGSPIPLDAGPCSVSPRIQPLFDQLTESKYIPVGLTLIFYAIHKENFKKVRFREEFQLFRKLRCKLIRLAVLQESKDRQGERKRLYVSVEMDDGLFA